MYGHGKCSRFTWTGTLEDCGRRPGSGKRGRTLDMPRMREREGFPHGSWTRTRYEVSRLLKLAVIKCH
ncbi:hypothetical protein SKAU_G00315090 [Synaphobranchus kaupii]|uniref:Uncharacterized protein n=1 Tax=Synaphobranchus kaupii TaxID=118154 RepID=A0A9Q1ESF5_SYNKA|nr:hypothetical protein SKAU_G00315090 [Synaphobranchus kaupii]